MQPVTLQDFASRWIRYREGEGRLQKTTLERDWSLLRGQILPAFGQKALVQLTAEDVRNFYASLCQELNRRTGIPQLHTARRAGAVLHKMLEDAVNLGLLSNNPARRVPLVKPAETSARPYSLEEITTLIRSTRDDFKPFVLVSILTGARFGEARELRWHDVDLERGFVYVRRQRPTHEPTVVRAPKRGIVRAVEMMDPVRTVLTSLPGGSPDDLIFPAAGGGPIDPSYFRRYVWTPALARSGLRLKPHEMRDIFVSLLIAFGEDIMRIARQTGHRNLAVFFSHYAHEIRRTSGTLSRTETYNRLMAAYHRSAEPANLGYVSVNQAAKLLGVSWGWLFELVRRGRLPAVRRGRALMIPRDRLKEVGLPRAFRKHAAGKGSNEIPVR